MAITISHVPKALWPVIGGSVAQKWRIGDVYIDKSIRQPLLVISEEGDFLWLGDEEVAAKISPYKLGTPAMDHIEFVATLRGTGPSWEKLAT